MVMDNQPRTRGSSELQMTTGASRSTCVDKVLGQLTNNGVCQKQREAFHCLYRDRYFSSVSCKIFSEEMLVTVRRFLQHAKTVQP